MQHPPTKVMIVGGTLTPALARAIAERVLSGLPIEPIVQPAQPAPIDPNKLEIKHCEMCPRTFTRPIGSSKRTCGCELHHVRKPKTRYRYTLIKNLDLVQAGTSRAYRVGLRAAMKLA